VTENDLERHNGRYLRYFTEFGTFWGQLHHSEVRSIMSTTSG